MNPFQKHTQKNAPMLPHSKYLNQKIFLQRPGCLLCNFLIIHFITKQLMTRNSHHKPAKPVLKFITYEN